MNTNQRKNEPGLVCTCNNLFHDELKASIKAGCDEPEDVMFDHNTQFKCCECKPILSAMINKYSDAK